MWAALRQGQKNTSGVFVVWCCSSYIPQFWAAPQSKELQPQGSWTQTCPQLAQFNLNTHFPSLLQIVQQICARNTESNHFFSPLMILIFLNYFFNFRKINKMLFGLLFSDWASGMTYTPPAEIHGFKNCLEHCAIAVLVTEVGLSFVLKKTVIAWFCLGKKLLCKRKKIGNFLFSVKALLHFAESLGLQREAAE